MALRYGFFDSVNGDRRYPASWFNEYFRGIIGSGVAPNPSTSFQVIGNGTMTITVKPGKYWAPTGEWCVNDNDIPFLVPTADVLYPRFDAIVLQLKQDVMNRKFDIIYKTGVPAASPKYPPADPTVTHEFVLGYVYVAKNANAIGQDGITDTRTKIASLINNVDTTTLYNQYQAALDRFLEYASEQLADRMALLTYTSMYKTVEVGQTVVPIGIPEYDRLTDILEVYINGLRRTRDKYIINGDGTEITTTLPMEVVGTEIEFVVYKSAASEGE